jgi:hypothetical protein
MDATALRELQAPLKAAYRERPQAALVTLKAAGDLADGAIACKVETGRALIEAGLHPATGGSGLEACSGDMLLEALVACAGVTLKAVATALEFRLRVAGYGPRAISISAARSGSSGPRRSDFAISVSPSTSAAGTDRYLAEADRALLRRAADPAHPATDRGDDRPACREIAR